MRREFTPDNLIDREAEQEIFEDLLKLKDDARLLTIIDKGGRGKSALLKRLHYNCVYRFDTPVALIELQHLSDPNPFQLIETIRGKLQEAFPDLPFSRFDQINDVRQRQDTSWFVTNAPFIEGRVDARDARVNGAGTQVAGVQVSNNTFNITASWTPGMEKNARERCRNAFFDDLKEICQERTIVLLFDTWDNCNSELQQWIGETLLRLHCFKIQSRPERLLIVMTGRPEKFPNFRNQYGELYFQVVRSIESFGEWDQKHVRDFLKVHGYEQVSDNEVSLLCDLIKRGGSLVKVLQLTELLSNPNE